MDPMNELDSLCDRCANGDFDGVVSVLQTREHIEELALACSARAEIAEKIGNSGFAKQLVAAMHYLNYLALPHD
jgi:hypothetical protein